MTLPGYFTHRSLIVNFFSYFTILTNLFITIWFVLAFRTQFMGQARWRGDRPEIKGALLVAGSVTILVYWTAHRRSGLEQFKHSENTACWMIHLTFAFLEKYSPTRTDSIRLCYYT
ncbi:MAG: hypothetical protein ACYDER_20405 [Ktedonobacteraceae bacterium]